MRYTYRRMKVSVIIPARNEARFIGACLEHLQRQQLPSQAFEVIVVDNGSTDATAAIVADFQTRLHVRLVTHATSSISAVRNHGASLASGEILAFLDADCLAGPDWLVHGIERALAHGVWGAHYRIPQDATWVGRTWSTYQAAEKEGDVSFLPAGDLFMHKASFVHLGGFSEDAHTSEDVDLCTRARRAGMPVVAIPELAVVHLGTPRSLAHFYRQNRWHGLAVLPLFLANLPSTANLGVVVFSLCTLFFFWLTVVCLMCGVFWRLWYLPAISAALLLVLPALLTLRKVRGHTSIHPLPGLFVLYLTYLLARAAAITHLARRGSFSSRRRTEVPAT